MKKFLGIIIVGLLTSNCEPTVDEKFSNAWGGKKSTKSGGSVRVDPWRKFTMDRIKNTATAYCKSQGAEYSINIRSSEEDDDPNRNYKAGGFFNWYFYDFDCYPVYKDLSPKKN